MPADDKIPGKIIPNHAYDGIEELDNPLPGWWVQMFWGTIVFSIGYFAYYQYMGGQSIDEELAADIKTHEEVFAANKKEAPSADDVNNMVADESTLALGKAQYLQKCAVCHAGDGGGGIGPNLTDDYWLNGDGSKAAVFNVISNGVPAKGMPAWAQVMSGDELNAVSQFVFTLKGATAASPKAPQGELRK